MAKSATILLRKIGGSDLKWWIDEKGVLQIESSLSKEEAKVLIPQLWPAWMFEESQ